MKKNDDFKNDKNNNKFPDELEKISSKYFLAEKSKITSNMDYILQNGYLNSIFTEKVLKMIDEEKLKEMKRRLDEHSYDSINKQVKEKILNIISEYNQIKEENLKDYEFYDKLLINIMCDYANKSNNLKDSERIFNEVSRDIIHTRIKNIIKNEKKILNMKEIIKEINFL